MQCRPSRWYHWIACGFGSGLSPIAPGTVGSIAALLIWWLVLRDLSFWVMGSICVVGLFLGVYLCKATAKDWQTADPSAIVWDEFIGLWVALLPLQMSTGILGPAMAFILFRVFDISKPSIIKKSETHLPPGWDIMMDDVLSGVISAIILVLAILVLANDTL